MLLTLLLALSLHAVPDLSELKLERNQVEATISSSLANGLTEAPLVRWSTRYPVAELDGAAKAALTVQALTQVKAFVEGPQGRESWQKFLTYGHDTVPTHSASLAADFAYWSTLVKEKRVKDPSDAASLERASQNLAVFKRERARLEQEELTRAKAEAQPDEAAFKAQLAQRLTYFLNETRALPFDAKLETLPTGKKRFADKALEARPKWWKFCFRAGPEATKAARDFATSWLSELTAPPSAAKLSEDK